jgi:peptidoglycan/xylan/chitin deacetylase (PgdA/CDA1 family)
VIVLCYHAIADHGDDRVLREFSVPPARFAKQLDGLALAGWTFVDLDAVLRAMADGGEPLGLPGRAVLITFDDGFTDFEHVALPELQRRGIPSVMFVLADRLGADNDWDQAIGAGPVSLMDAAALRRVAAQGVEIGSHGRTHRRLPELSGDALASEVGESAAAIEALGLPRPRVFAYPYGDHSPAVDEAVRAAGYAAAVTIDPGGVDRGTDRYAVPRLMVLRGWTPRMLRLRIATRGVRSELWTRLCEIVGTRG